jgi:hypothetical protein
MIDTLRRWPTPLKCGPVRRRIAAPASDHRTRYRRISEECLMSIMLFGLAGLMKAAVLTDPNMKAPYCRQ